MNKIYINLDGLTCSSCAIKIEDNIKEIVGVNKVHINMLKQIMTVVYENNNQDELITEIIKIVNKFEPNVVASLESSKEVKHVKKFNLKLLRLLFGTALIFLMLFTEFKFQFYIAIFTYAVFGYDIIILAVKNILRGNFFDENFLMSFATVAAIAIGEINEAIGVMVFFRVGEYFQDLAIDKSRNSIENLMDIKVESAITIKNGQEISVDPSELQIDDIILVKVGEKIPVDGVIVDGKTQLDTSSITGESTPRTAKQGEFVISGSLNLSSVIKMKVLKRYEDSTVNKIIELVNESSEKKAKAERFITKFAKLYTPIVLGLAVLLTLIPSLINPNSFSMWFERSLIFLVVSCPCALVASIPLTFFSGIGYASSKGIMVKGGMYLQELSNCSKVVFDKTGTLTKGTFKVVDFKTSIDETEFFTHIFNCERYSNHPIAKSIVSYVNNNYKIEELGYQVDEISGKGLKASFKNDVVLVGNRKLIDNITEIGNNGTTVYVSLNNKYIGYVTVADEIKPEAFEAIALIKERGIETVMLTGDSNTEAKKIADLLNIDRVYSDLLPQDKVEKLNELCNESKNATIFVGDGINDAPVLKRSDIGVAMGAVGSDAAIEASDIVIMNDNLLKLNEGFLISKNTLKLAKQNIVFSIGVKVVVLILSVFGLVTMWGAIFSDVGVALIAILNSSRRKI